MRAHGDADALLSARFIVTGALNRNESRGGHFRTDCPATDTAAQHTRMTLADLAASTASPARYREPAE
jgi:L-aspartate oxidase